MLLVFYFGIHIDDWTKLLASSAHSDSTCKIQIIGKRNIIINLSQPVNSTNIFYYHDFIYLYICLK